MLAAALLVANIVVGLSIGDYNGAFRDWFDALEQERQLKQISAPTSEVEAATQAVTDASRALQPFKETVGTHLLLGLIAAFMTLLVKSITVTYFIGTSRWALEVVETYELDTELAEASNRLKRAAFRWALLGIVAVFAIAVLGAFSDPAGPFLTGAAVWVTPHLMTAILGTALIAWALWMQVAKIGANHDVIEQIVAQVRKIRAERGLED